MSELCEKTCNFDTQVQRGQVSKRTVYLNNPVQLFPTSTRNYF
jgi:hypothetical protein